MTSRGLVGLKAAPLPPLSLAAVCLCTCVEARPTSPPPSIHPPPTSIDFFHHLSATTGEGRKEMETEEEVEMEEGMEMGG